MKGRRDELSEKSRFGNGPIARRVKRLGSLTTLRLLLRAQLPFQHREVLAATWIACQIRSQYPRVGALQIFRCAAASHVQKPQFDACPCMPLKRRLLEQVERESVA